MITLQITDNSDDNFIILEAVELLPQGDGELRVEPHASRKFENRKRKTMNPTPGMSDTMRTDRDEWLKRTAVRELAIYIYDEVKRNGKV